MCYGDDARPPLPPISGGASDQGDLHLTSADGARFMAYAARAQQPTGRGMVILPDVRGLHDFYKELAVRFAEAGFEAIAFDYFARTAGDGDRSEAFEFRSHVDQSRPESVASDVRACIDYLRSSEGGEARSIFTVGFCFGGAASWRQSANNGDLVDGCIGFYGGRPMERVGPWLGEMRQPLLMLLAGEDSTTPEEFELFASEVRKRGVEVEAQTYEGAPHSYFDRTFDEWREACDDSWRRILDFTARNSKARP